jgi:hypothetical protein
MEIHSKVTSMGRSKEMGRGYIRVLIRRGRVGMSITAGGRKTQGMERRAGAFTITRSSILGTGSMTRGMGKEITSISMRRGTLATGGTI